MKKTLFVTCCALATVLSLNAENLIKNSKFDQKLTSDCRIGNIVPGHAKLSIFTEDATKNKCAKFELLSIFKKGDNDGVNANLLLGKKRFGFLVKPNTTYKFSFEIKGTVPNVGLRAMEWTGTDFWKDRKNLKTSIGKVKISDKWQKIEGSFKTDSEAKTAVLAIQMWWDTKYGPMKYKLGDYILIDNVVIEEMTDTVK